MHKLKKLVLTAGICLLSLAVGNPAMAADGATVYQAACLACHGPDAKTPIMPLYPKLAGQNEEYLLNQLNAFIKEVEAQRGKKITEEQADVLVEYAQWIIDNI